MDPERVRLVFVFLTLPPLASGCGASPTSPSAEQLIVEPAAARVTETGDSLRFRAFLVSDDRTSRSVEATWSSSAPSIVSVDDQGWARALATGGAVIEAEYGGMRARSSLLVDGDTLAPELSDIFARVTRVNVSLGPSRVPIEAEFLDQGSGVRSAIAIFDGPLGAGITGLVTLVLEAEDTLSDGTVVGTFRGSLDIPGITGVGTWTLSALRADDRSGNSRRWGEQDLAALGRQVEIVASTSGR